MLDFLAMKEFSERNFSNIEESSSPKIPQSSKQNLMSKIDSLMRSIENLTQKKARITFEITRQKRSLARKREELKRVQKSQSAKASIQLESTGNTELSEEISGELKRIQNLLSESARILED